MVVRRLGFSSWVLLQGTRRNVSIGATASAREVNPTDGNYCAGMGEIPRRRRLGRIFGVFLFQAT